MRMCSLVLVCSLWLALKGCIKYVKLVIADRFFFSSFSVPQHCCWECRSGSYDSGEHWWNTGKTCFFCVLFWYVSGTFSVPYTLYIPTVRNEYFDVWNCLISSTLFWTVESVSVVQSCVCVCVCVQEKETACKDTLEMSKTETTTNRQTNIQRQSDGEGHGERQRREGVESKLAFKKKKKYVFRIWRVLFLNHILFLSLYTLFSNAK